jgi:homoserine O-acetyltransferase
VHIDPALFEENERTAPVQDERQFLITGPYRCEVGGELPQVTIAYETWGELNDDRSNAVLVCHALTGDAHAIGWWERLIGPGKPIDTETCFVIGVNVLGGCQGSTGPASTAPDGKRYSLRFPMVTVGDMVEVQARLIDHLGIDSLLAVAGGSMGGMQALEWTGRFPNRVRKAFITASCAAHSAMQVGFNETARQAIMQDTRWMGGDYPDGEQPDGGLSVARMLGHISFLSDAAFTAKFGRRLQDKVRFDYTFGTEFQVESYLKYQGSKFTNRFDANSLLYVTRAIDYYDLPSLQGSNAEYLFTSFTSDWLYPSYQSEAMHQMALAAGCQSQHEVIDLPYGHDAFLLDGLIQGEMVRRFLNN